MEKTRHLDTQHGDPRRRVRSIGGREILLDDEGFFWNPEDWSEEIAEILARESGLEEMTQDHWRVIGFLRNYFFENGRSPLNRQLKNGLGMSLRELENLFPGGIKLGARRLAGLPNPQSCT